MGIRRKGRESALQLLYQRDTCHQLQRDIEKPYASAAPLIFNTELADLTSLKSIEDFTQSIVQGVLKHLQEIDSQIETHATHWKLSRMDVVDRNVLRMAIYELLYCQEVPKSVAINEAIEVAKTFGTHESAAFINGILDRIAQEIKK